MEIFVMNAAARVDGMLGKILSTLNEKNFSCGLKVYSDRMQIVAKKAYANKIKIFTVGKNLSFRRFVTEVIMISHSKFPAVDRFSI